MNSEKLLTESYIDELISADLYDYLKSIAKEDSLRTAFSRLAEVEKSHATLLKKILINRGITCPEPGLTFKIKAATYKVLARILGYKILLSLMEASEASAIKTYWSLLKEASSEFEKQALEVLLKDEISHEVGLQESLNLYVKTLQGLKDIVYGMIDALIEIEAGVIGIASATNSPSLAGLAGLIAGLAGSFSMASGAYLSTKSEK
ncbi:MAG: VIT1/CCC1 transporter family protein, partial [Thermosphaera sp.]